MLERTGANLVGGEVWTPKFGDWPGGWATVTEIVPDVNAPGIAFNVQSEEHGEAGILDNELIEFAQYQ